MGWLARVARVSLAALVGLLLVNTARVAVAADPARSAAKPVESAAKPVQLSTADVLNGLDRALTGFHDRCQKHGGYVWRYSRDLTLSEGEAETDRHTVWVQPPGTPAVGLAFLEAYTVSHLPRHLDYARAAGNALVAGQMRSGGWAYSITFDPEQRRLWHYRQSTPDTQPVKKAQNRTTLDDDTTTAALRFLITLDRTTDFREPTWGEAIRYAFTAFETMQRPNGGWPQNWKTDPIKVDEREFPILSASYPENWSRTWDNAWTGRYYLNDNVTTRVIELCLFADGVYRQTDPELADRCRTIAIRSGDFLLRARMPEPQPAWAQQYNVHMQPVWDRKFEPPAISGGESQQVLRTLMELYRATGEARFLEPIPRTLEYLRSCQLPDGRLPRFRELRTNRPLYFTKDYRLTDEPNDLPTHYGFLVNSRLDSLESDFQKIRQPLKPARVKPPSDDQRRSVAKRLAALDDRGLWVEPRPLRGYNKASPEGTISSETFLENVSELVDFLRRAAGSETPPS